MIYPPDFEEPCLPPRMLRSYSPRMPGHLRCTVSRYAGTVSGYAYYVGDIVQLVPDGFQGWAFPSGKEIIAP